MSIQKRSTILAIVALALIVSATALAANKPTQPSDTPPYDSHAEYVVKGTVTTVKTHDSVMGYKDTHFIMTTSIGDIEVHVAPVAYLAKRGLDVQPGDEVVVTGCKTTWEEKTVLVARQVKKGDLTVKMRNQQGKPVWPKDIRS